MITLQECEAQFAAPPNRARAAPAARTILYVTLFITILISPLVFIEPAPYEFVAGILGLTCLMARVPLEARIWPLVLMLVVWNIGGVIAMTGVIDEDLTVRFVAISLFMAFSAVIYGCLFAQDDMTPLSIMRRTYIVAAAFVAVIGIVGYFNMFPGAMEKFAGMGRAQGTFKDPNVFGPFLILPLLMLIHSLLIERIKLRQVAFLLIILAGLFLSFSRGAWFHFSLSAACMIALMFITAPDARTRARLTLLTAIAIGLLATILVFSLSFDAVGGMFKERAKLIQDYDAGSSMGRFNLQQLAVGRLLENPLGLGPYGMQRLYGLQQHNTYLQAFLVYGWMGGLSYVAMILMTAAVGLRAALRTSPWQPYAITAFAAFVGVCAEGFVIDTDHWRHFFLYLGIVWGTFAATSRNLAR